MKADRAKTIAQQYLDPKSFMRADGSEVLAGEDWKARIENLRQRCGGQCEHRDVAGPWSIRCTREAQDPHHIIRRSVKRDDRLANLLALCRFHHDLLDFRKPRWSRAGRP